MWRVGASWVVPRDLVFFQGKCHLARSEWAIGYHPRGIATSVQILTACPRQPLSRFVFVRFVVVFVTMANIDIVAAQIADAAAVAEAPAVQGAAPATPPAVAPPAVVLQQAPQASSSCMLPDLLFVLDESGVPGHIVQAFGEADMKSVADFAGLATTEEALKRSGGSRILSGRFDIEGEDGGVEGEPGLEEGEAPSGRRNHSCGINEQRDGTCHTCYECGHHASDCWSNASSH